MTTPAGAGTGGEGLTHEEERGIAELPAAKIIASAAGFEAVLLRAELRDKMLAELARLRALVENTQENYDRETQRLAMLAKGYRVEVDALRARRETRGICRIQDGGIASWCVTHERSLIHCAAALRARLAEVERERNKVLLAAEEINTDLEAAEQRVAALVAFLVDVAGMVHAAHRSGTSWLDCETPRCERLRALLPAAPPEGRAS